MANEGVLSKQISDSSTYTLCCFFAGVVLLACRDVLIAAAVFFLGFAIVGELQRKANDIIEAMREPADYRKAAAGDTE